MEQLDDITYTVNKKADLTDNLKQSPKKVKPQRDPKNYRTNVVTRGVPREVTKYRRGKFPRSQILGNYFAFLGLFSTLIEMEFLNFEIEQYQAAGHSLVSYMIRIDKLLANINILGLTCFTIAVLTKLAWTCNRTETTSAFMGSVVALVTLLINAMHNEPNAKTSHTTPWSAEGLKP